MATNQIMLSPETIGFLITNKKCSLETGSEMHTVLVVLLFLNIFIYSISVLSRKGSLTLDAHCKLNLVKDLTLISVWWYLERSDHLYGATWCQNFDHLVYKIVEVH